MRRRKSKPKLLSEMPTPPPPQLKRSRGQSSPSEVPRQRTKREPRRYQTTLIQVLIQDSADRVLLAKQRDGAFAGRWLGLLDACGPEEMLVDACSRIAWEQVGVTLASVQRRAVLLFASVDDGPTDQPCEEHEFVARLPGGAIASAKGASVAEVRWFEADALPFDRMPADDAIWYGPVLEGRLLRGRFLMDDMGRRVVSHTIEDVAEL